MFVADRRVAGRRSSSSAWREVIRNAAHDSICACSVDEVVDAVLHRFDEARAIADGVAERALGRSAVDAGRRLRRRPTPSASPRRGVVEVVLIGDTSRRDERVQVISERTALPGELVLDAQTARTLLSIIESPRLDDDAWIEQVHVEEDADEIVLTVTVGPVERPSVRLDEVRARRSPRLDALPDARRPRPAGPAAHPPRARKDRRGPRARVAPLRARRPSRVRRRADDAGRVTLSNGLVTVVVDADTGTFSLDGHAGFGRLVDGGDLGDSYNYSPPAGDSVVDAPGRGGRWRSPSAARCARAAVITATYEWPDHVDGASQQRVGVRTVEVATTLSVVADERAVRVRTTFVNPSRDHRLRVHLPTVERRGRTPSPSAPFGTVRRGLTAEGRPDEFGLPTFPSRRFVAGGPPDRRARGAPRVRGDRDRATGAGHELAVTLLRSTGMLSRLGMTLRPMPAGPLTPVEGLQLVGDADRRALRARARRRGPLGGLRRRARPARGDDRAGRRLARRQGLVARGRAGRRCRASRSSTASSSCASSTRADHVDDVSRSPGRRGWEVDLRGRRAGPFEGRCELRGRGIATLRLATSRPAATG